MIYTKAAMQLIYTKAAMQSCPRTAWLTIGKPPFRAMSSKRLHGKPQTTKRGNSTGLSRALASAGALYRCRLNVAEDVASRKHEVAHQQKSESRAAERKVNMCVVCYRSYRRENR